MLAALPFASQVFQLPAAWLTQRFGARAVAVVATAGSRLVWLPMALVPLYLGPGRDRELPLFIGVVTVAALMAVVGNNAWTAWMAAIVPRAIRGRYFSRRTVYVTIAGTSATLAVGVIVDALTRRGFHEEGLAALAGLGCAAGVVTVVLLLRQHDPDHGRRRRRPDWRGLRIALRDERACSFARYLALWNAAVALSAGFFGFHMLANLGTGLALAALHGVAVALVRIVSAPLWGRAVDRLGARPVLVLCSFGIALVPALWLFASPSFLWPIALEAVIAGALWGGHGIATMDLTMHLSAGRQRPFYLAVFGAAGGLAFATTSVLAGFFASQLPARFDVLGRAWTSMHVLFLLSALARAVAALPALRIEEADARSVRELLRALGADIGDGLRRRVTPLVPWRHAAPRSR